MKGEFEAEQEQACGEQDSGPGRQAGFVSWAGCPCGGCLGAELRSQVRAQWERVNGLTSGVCYGQEMG